MRRIGIVLTMVAATLLAAAGVARADGPTHEWVPIDDTFTFSDCGFPVEEHDVATLHFIAWFDAEGNRTRQLVAAPGSRITWTNTLTGASVTTANPYAVHKRDNADGSLTVAFTGLQFVLHGGGRAYVDSGRDLVLFSEAGANVLASAGPSADFCAALTAAIG